MSRSELSGSEATLVRDGELWCEDVRLAEIGDAVGTPCYVYSEHIIRSRFTSFASTFKDVDHRVFYSVKANHNLAVLETLRGLGAGADVVSVGELHRAKLAGFAGSDIVFGGVGKRNDELEAALAAEIFLVNVESESELCRLSEAAARQGTVARVGIRVNPGVEASTHSYTQTGHYGTKFGVAREDAVDVYARAAELSGIEPRGINAHIGSQILQPEPYQQTLQLLVDLVRDIRRRRLQVDYIDIGGGFGIRHDTGAGIDLDAVAHMAVEACSDIDVVLLFEPGRWLVAPAGILLTRVLYTKQLGDRVYCVTDTGSNDFMRPSYYSAHHPIEAVRDGPREVTADVVGPVCETGDFLGRDRKLPKLGEGDLLAVMYAGAYGLVMSSNYNSRPRAAEVLVAGSSYRVVRRRESLDDLVALERDNA